MLRHLKIIAILVVFIEIALFIIVETHWRDAHFY